MKTDYFEQSMIYERASSECTALMIKLRDKRNAAEDRARKDENEPDPSFYTLVIDELKQIKRKFDSTANQYWELHKLEKPELDEDGINNLLVAVVSSWAADFEHALSRQNKAKTDELRDEAQYFVRDSIVSRIKRTHRQFVKRAHEHIGEIVEDSLRERDYAAKHHFGVNHNSERMRNRCPLCGSGMYAKRTKTGLFLVKCAGCYLTEIVKVEDEPWKN